MYGLIGQVIYKMINYLADTNTDAKVAENNRRCNRENAKYSGYNTYRQSDKEKRSANPYDGNIQHEETGRGNYKCTDRHQRSQRNTSNTRQYGFYGELGRQGSFYDLREFLNERYNQQRGRNDRASHHYRNYQQRNISNVKEFRSHTASRPEYNSGRKENTYIRIGRQTGEYFQRGSDSGRVSNYNNNARFQRRDGVNNNSYNKNMPSNGKAQKYEDGYSRGYNLGEDSFFQQEQTIYRGKSDIKRFNGRQNGSSQSYHPYRYDTRSQGFSPNQNQYFQQQQANYGSKNGVNRYNENRGIKMRQNESNHFSLSYKNDASPTQNSFSQQKWTNYRSQNRSNNHYKHYGGQGFHDRHSHQRGTLEYNPQRRQERSNFRTLNNDQPVQNIESVASVSDATHIQTNMRQISWDDLIQSISQDSKNRHVVDENPKSKINRYHQQSEYDAKMENQTGYNDQAVQNIEKLTCVAGYIQTNMIEIPRDNTIQNIKKENESQQYSTDENPKSEIKSQYNQRKEDNCKMENKSHDEENEDNYSKSTNLPRDLIIDIKQEVEENFIGTTPEENVEMDYIISKFNTVTIV